MAVSAFHFVRARAAVPAHEPIVERPFGRVGVGRPEPEVRLIGHLDAGDRVEQIPEAVGQVAVQRPPGLEFGAVNQQPVDQPVEPVEEAFHQQHFPTRRGAVADRPAHSAEISLVPTVFHPPDPVVLVHQEAGGIPDVLVEPPLVAAPSAVARILQRRFQ